MKERIFLGVNNDPVGDILKEIWLERWDTPIEWSINLAHTSSELGEIHKKRLSVFYGEIKDLFSGIPPEEKPHET